MDTARPAPASLRPGVKSRLDVLPNWERKLKLQRAHRAAYWRLWEETEVARLSRGIGELPHAEVAVVVPTYQRPELVRAAVESALCQSFQDLVVVVVDDGGGAVQHVPRDDRVHVRRLRRNTAVLGVVNNIGIRTSSSRYVAVLNDDNSWHPDHLACAVRALEAGSDIVYTGMSRRRPSGEPVDSLAVPFDRALLRSMAYTDSSTLVARRSGDLHFSRVPRGKCDFPMEDWEFVWRYSRRRRVTLVPEITVDYLIHDGSYLTDWTPFWKRRESVQDCDLT